MGRHSRRGPALKGDAADIAAGRGDGRGARSGDEGAGGVPGSPGGAPARDADGTPARGVPRLADATPARGVPKSGGGAPAPEARGGHPEQREAGGGWGEFGARAAGGAGSGAVLPRQRQAEPGAPRPGGSRRRPGPRQEYLEAFEGAGERGRSRAENGTSEEPAAGAGVPAQRGGARGRAFTGIAAAAVTTVLAVVVAGQVTKAQDDDGVRARSVTGPASGTGAPGDTSGVPAATAPGAAALTYDQKMAEKYPLSAELAGPGKFDAVPGFDKAPGTGQKYRYRVDVEQGLGLDGALFAEAVQQTLNDKRSWAHGGALAFERISSGKPDFVITLASPGTTAKWCAKSGLDTTEDNVSCDSAATERVMINAYRWAQGSRTYGDRIHAYRQMLINHEVGHRLGHGHVSCRKDGELAPVMQQQTKFLDHDGIHCRANPWPFPRS
ncbi:DUF3152 domain-containing protein [Streptomyces sp. NRRL S-1022]|uniref:DUF3152 domain-containing protein n=1 Tax=Streptomyces sp. NRRL S-1022 TaxID=1463880 RepID=UPI000AADB7D8|nr:DUF3152 domain-containing protein [Streptomyces sp. NRRL S-1022]